MFNTRRFLFALGLVSALLSAPGISSAQIGISVSIAPPVLPVYEQPVIPEPGYLWTPGYWAWGGADYYWVPGTWVQPPVVGVLWTPGYWGWGDGVYLFHEGYWGPHIGFYGGINYGFGYTGSGYFGGRWENGAFAYNRAVNNVNTTIVHNVYNTTVVNNVGATRASFNGGTGGVAAQPTAAERAVENEAHTPATAAQTQHVAAARENKSLYAANNGGRPPVAATAHAGALSGAGVVAARGAGAANGTNRVARPPAEHAAAPAEHTAAPAARAATPAAHAAAPAAHAAAAPHPAAAPRAPTPAAHAEAPHPQPAARPAAPQEHAAAPRGGNAGHEEHR
ncbi:MAG: YXWGXW repeat-containing protein [Burkholderiaceae bacterium]|jgi:hypothetical protein